MTLAWFDLERARGCRWTGVGNVEARLVRAGAGAAAATTSRSCSAASSATSCRACARPRSRSRRATLLVFATDGIDGATSRRRSTGGGAAQALAERIFGEHGKGTDDALAVVVRWLG